MSLAQSIHRLTVLHNGKLSKEDATPITGDTDELLHSVTKQVMSGDKSIAEAISDDRRRIERLTNGDISSIDDDEGPLLNLSLYNHLVSTLSLPPLSNEDASLLESHYRSSLESLSSLIAKATEEMGDTEVLSAKLAVARYSTKHLDKEAALSAYEEVLSSPKLSLGKRLDALLEMARVASFWNDVPSLVGTVEIGIDAIVSRLIPPCLTCGRVICERAVPCSLRGLRPFRAESCASIPSL
jgi:hypothetical protein